MTTYQSVKKASWIAVASTIGATAFWLVAAPIAQRWHDEWLMQLPADKQPEARKRLCQGLGAHMRLLPGLVLPILLTHGLLVASEGAFVVASAESPTYPVVARLARVSGKVVVGVKVGSDGSVIEASAISGPLMLRGPAVDNLKTWKFARGKKHRELKVIYDYRLEGEPLNYSPCPKVIFQLPTTVVIISNPPVERWN